MPRWFNSSCFAAELEHTSMAVLELSHCSLTTVPSDIFKSKEGKLLEEVYLDANQLRDLPRALFSLQNLQVLNLSDNELTIIPSAISNLTNLREVNFSKNGIIDLPENIKNCKNLQEIDASVNPIGKISEGVSQLINLTHLYLNDAFIDFLPASFGRLAKLEILELRDNHLRVLPKSMSHLTKLERLDIGSNEFVELPAVVGCLLNLKELWVDNNSIRELKPEIGLLRQLVFLDVSKNRLEWLPPEIESLQALTDLHLSNNLLIELPEQIGFLSSLQTLKLDENHLGELPNSIGRLQNLEELVLTCNELVDFPSSIGYLRKLRVLYGDENFLESIPSELGSCSSMTILSLRDNKLEFIPEDIGRMPNLQVINLACNKLEYLPYTFHKLDNLKALWLSENQSKSIVPLQSEYNKAKRTHVLTCYMFPQQPIPEEDNVSMNSVEIHDDQENGNLDSVTLETLPEPTPSVPPNRSSIVFDIDEDDYLARLARFSSPYPKDVKDRAAQYLASRRQHQHTAHDNNNQPDASRHQCHQHQHEARDHRHLHNKPVTCTEPKPDDRHSVQSGPAPPGSVMAPVSEPLPELPPAPPFVHDFAQEQRHSREIPDQGMEGTRQRRENDPSEGREVPWYEEPPRDSSESGSVVSVHSDHSASINPRRNIAISSTRPTFNGEASIDTRREPDRRIPPENSTNGVLLASGQVPLYPPHPQNMRAPQAIPPPVYTSQTQQSSSSYASSLPSHYSFREEAPSSSSSMRNPPTGEWVQHNPRDSQSSTLSYEDVHSFRSEEPSMVYGNNRNNQPVLRPPSYHEAIGHRNTAEEIVNHLYVDQLRPNARRTIDTTSEVDPNFSPPPGYSTIDPRVWSQESYSQSSGQPTSGYITSDRQPVSLSRPETTRVPQTGPTYAGSTQDTELFEERVRQMQIQRREGRRVIDSSSSDQDISSVSRNPVEEVRAPLASRDDEEQFTVRIHKNPNLGFSIAGGKESTTNPYDPTDPKCIYVTKVQPEGPAAYSLKPGDKILEVNGINLRSILHEHAVTFLKNNQIVDLLISRKAEEL